MSTPVVQWLELELAQLFRVAGDADTERRLTRARWLVDDLEYAGGLSSEQAGLWRAQLEEAARPVQPGDAAGGGRLDAAEALLERLLAEIEAGRPDVAQERAAGFFAALAAGRALGVLDSSTVETWHARGLDALSRSATVPVMTAEQQSAHEALVAAVTYQPGELVAVQPASGQRVAGVQPTVLLFRGRAIEVRWHEIVAGDEDSVMARFGGHEAPLAGTAPLPISLHDDLGREHAFIRFSGGGGRRADETEPWVTWSGALFKDRLRPAARYLTLAVEDRRWTMPVSRQ